MLLKFELESLFLWFRKYPNTLLGDFDKCKYYFDWNRNEFFFDRNREAFDCIFFFYQSGGRLLKPQNMAPEEFLDELRLLFASLKMEESFVFGCVLVFSTRYQVPQIIIGLGLVMYRI